MSQLVTRTLSIILAAVWLFTAAVTFQAGSTDGDLSLLWFSPAVTAVLVPSFFVSTWLFYAVERYAEARVTN